MIGNSSCGMLPKPPPIARATERLPRFVLFVGHDHREGTVRHAHHGVDHTVKDVGRGDVNRVERQVAGEFRIDEHGGHRKREAGPEDERAVFAVLAGLFALDERTHDRVVDCVPDPGDPEDCRHDGACDAENVGTVGGKIGSHDAERQIVGGVTDRIADIVFCGKLVSHDFLSFAKKSGA